ncbi:YgiQ family radical SAM protein [Desulfosporosinus sp. Sb-LF]|uniref:YgiQ family radical SAM protein n=1 Tax=Desulfosporosinus sp. Sb-LF TaxID=2560027 RepID=UPI00107F279B|nr:YgiQ family radical SAM protein [Desulfosporosinus sp. Sb-LF]TGE32253.1 YgiQ family radical SAM protein [Desulfosporosinus sp. Sb-LF]
MRIRNFLPMSRSDMEAIGWNELDFLLITGDAYVDHPSFGIAIIARILEKHDFRVGILAQPNWKDLKDFRVMGKPRLACLITGGNLDSMVNHYTAAKKRRHKDVYSPGGKPDLRPDRSTIAYTNRVREALPGVPVIIGGIEASLRRFAHYDYWSNDVRRSILLDSQADLLVFGMAEKSIVEVAQRLNNGEQIGQITDVRGTMVPLTGEAAPQEALVLPSFDEVASDKKKYAEAFWVQYNQQDPFHGKPMVQSHGRKSVLQNRPSLPLTQPEMDAIYALPFMGTYHPSYEELGGVPAIEEVEFSLTSVRGCYGACSFCALTFHQGRIIQSRSAESIIREAEQMTWNDRFKGYIHDVGGPTANFRRPACQKQLTKGACSHKQCLFPEPCDKLDNDHEEYLDLLRRLRGLPKVKKVFVRSGIRYDAVLADRNSRFIKELCEHHVSGQLKVAPEHVSDKVLRLMGKPGKAVYEEFVQQFQDVNHQIGKEQYLVPYLMSSHPGSTLKEAVELAEYVRDMGVNPEQVQDFIPTPGTLSTCMYFTGLDPRTMEPVYIPRSMHEKAMQRALIQYRSPRNHELVEEALRLVHREDLIGYGPKCLIRPKRYLRDDSNEPGNKKVKGPTRRSGMKKKEVSSAESSYKGAPSKEGRFKATRSAEPAYKGAPGKEGRYKDARGAEPAYKGAPSKEGRYKDARGAEPAYKGAPGKEGRYKDTRSAEPAYKSVPSKEAENEGVQEKGRFWRGSDNQIHKGQKKHRGAKNKNNK